jgi:hypothetical protein
MPHGSPLVIDLLDEEVFSVNVKSPWELYFDGASLAGMKPEMNHLAKELELD